MANDLDGTADRMRREAAGLVVPRTERRPPPADTGKRLATIQRGDDEELRVSWAEYEGRPFLSLRVWKRDRSGSWWPDKARGLTVRVRELAAFVEGVAAAVGEAKAAQGATGAEPGSVIRRW